MWYKHAKYLIMCNTLRSWCTAFGSVKCPTKLQMCNYKAQGL
jgi:hypothetical protein